MRAFSEAAAVIFCAILTSLADSPIRSANNQARQGATAEDWAVPYGNEFWRNSKKTSESASQAVITDAIERVSSAFQGDGENPSAATPFYTIRPTQTGFAFQPAGHASVQMDTVINGFAPEEPLKWRIEGNTAQTRAGANDPVVEHLETRSKSAFLTWIIPEAPRAPDLKIEVRIRGVLPAGETSTGLHFTDTSGRAGIRFGRITAVDSAGRSWPLDLSLTATGVKIEVPFELLSTAVYPLAIDPEIAPEQGLDLVPVAAEAAGEVEHPRMASNDREFLAIWNRRKPNGYLEIRGARILFDGTVADPGGFPISEGFVRDDSDAAPPAIASNGTDFLVAWPQVSPSNAVMAAVVSSSGKVRRAGSIARFGTTYPTYPLSTPDIASDGQNYLVVWQNNYRVWGRMADPDALNYTAEPVEISQGTANGFPRTAWNGNNYAVVWRGGGVSLRHLNSAGELIEEAPVKISSTSTNPQYPNLAFATGGGHYLIAWDTSLIRSDLSGGTIETLTPPALTAVKIRDAVWDGESFWAAWTDENSIWVNRLSSDGQWLDQRGRRVILAPEQTIPDENEVQLCLANSMMLIDYLNSGSREARARFPGNPPEDIPPGFAPGFAFSSSYHKPAPALTRFGDGYLLAWRAGRTAERANVYAARLGASGELLDPAGILIGSASADQSTPAVASFDETALVVWGDDFEGRSPFGLCGARVSLDGTLLDPEPFQVFSAPNWLEKSPRLAAGNSQYLLIWDNQQRNSDYSISPEWQIKGVMLDGTGHQKGVSLPIHGGEEPVNGYFPQVASDGNDFLVTWSSPASASPGGEGGIAVSGSTGQSFGIYAARVASSGTVLDAGPITVSTGTEQDPVYAPAIAWTGSNYQLAWLRGTDFTSGYADVVSALVSPGGTVFPERVVASGPLQRDWLMLAPIQNGSFAAWRESGSGNGLSSVLGTFLGSAGAPADAPFAVTGANFTGSLAAAGTEGSVLIGSDGARPGAYRLNWNRISVPPEPGASGSVDSDTGGDWKSAYAGPGAIIAGDSFNAPSFASITLQGADTWVWNDATSATAALERAGSASRIAACWYSPSSFEARLSFSDSAEHATAFYLLDWDTADRGESIDVLDANTGALLSSQTVSDFHSGKYLVFQLRGEVRIRFTRQAGLNAVLSGIFFPGDSTAAPSADPPEFSPQPGSWMNPVSVTISSSTPGASIYYTLDGTDPAVSSALYNGPIQVDKTTAIKAVATAPGYQDSATVSATYSISSSASENPVRLVAHDSVTQGNWIDRYGRDGYILFGDSQHLPNYAAASIANGSAWTWSNDTTDPAALQRSGDPGTRLAACLYSSDFVEVQIRLPSAGKHQLAIYLLDYTADRNEKIELWQNGVLYFSEALSSFHAGEYLVFEVSGPITLRARRVAGLNAVISGIFFDQAAEPGAVAAIPEITPSGGSFAGPVQISLSSATTGDAIYYTTDGSAPGISSTLYTGPFTLESSASLSARAFKDGMDPSEIANASFTIATAGESAAVEFAGLDTSTQGSWRGHLGLLGYLIAQDGTSLPENATATLTGQNNHIWAYNVTDAAALEMSSASGRIASCWYSPTQFEFDFQFGDAQPHLIEIYFLDWDNAGRSERVEVMGADSGATLNTQEVSSFVNGTWAKWKIQGHVRIRVTRMAGPNAVVSALCIDSSQ